MLFVISTRGEILKCHPISQNKEMTAFKNMLKNNGKNGSNLTP